MPRTAPLESTPVRRDVSQRSSLFGRQSVPFAALFVISGSCALVYQVVWSRLLVTVFGVTAFAVSTVLVSFMGGMAIGAVLMGRRADRSARPLRLFAMLEGGIGLYALALPALLALVARIYDGVFPVLPESFLLRSTIRFVFSLSLLIVPTILMGGTLPALGRGLLRRQREVGLGVGFLYFINTLGASAGCYLAGFVLLPTLGLTRTTWLAAALNGLVAGTAWLLERSLPAEAPPGDDPAETVGARGDASDTVAATRPASWPLWVAFGSGLAGLAFEVVWFRVLVLAFGSTVYSFSAMLTFFLLGIALGSAAIGPFVDRARHPVRLLAFVQGVVGVSALASYFVVDRMPAAFLHLITWFGIDFHGMNATKLVLSGATLIVPGLAFGATFPVVVRLAAFPSGGTGARIGRAYAWNTVGAILGAFLTGFVLLPTIGSEGTLKAIVALALLLSFGTLLAEAGPLSPRWAVPAGLVLVVAVSVLILAPRWDRRLLGAGVYFEPHTYVQADGRISIEGVVRDYELMTFTEGYNETITSYESTKGKFITVNGSPTASDHYEDMFAQRMLAHLPMALHEGPVRSAFVVGLGAGVTAGAIGVHDVGRLVVAELEEGVLVASRFFGRQNHDVLDNPKLELHIDDARNYLRLTEKRFDVISSHPNFPSLTGSGALFNRDFLELCRSRLAPRGLLVSYAPFWRLLPRDAKTIIGTFVDVFPHARVFSTGVTFVMMGSNDPFPKVDLDEVARRVSRPAVRESLAEIGVKGPLELLSFYQFDEAEARSLAGDAARSSDDRPRVEFNAPRGAFEDTIALNLVEMSRVRPGPEVRAGRLGLVGDDARAFIAFASAYESAREGEILVFEKKLDEALDKLVPAAESGQRYARYLVAETAQRLALAFQLAGRTAEARHYFEMALWAEPDRLEALAGAGYLAMFEGRLDEADRLLSRGAELYPKAAGVLYRLGALREIQGRPAEAEGLFRLAVGARGSTGPAHAMLADLLYRRGSAAEALDHFESAYDLGERSEGSLVGRAQALLATGRGGAALDAAREAATAFPSSAEAWLIVARAAEAAGRADEAVAARGRLAALAAGSASGGSKAP